MFSINGKVFLITGAAGHLGSPITKRLYDAGAHLYINGRNRKKLEDLAKELNTDTAKLHILDFDISDQEACNKAIEQIASNYGRLDGLVNNAYTPLSGSVYEATAEDFQKSFDINVSATFELSKKCFGLLSKSENETASIVNIASMYGIVSPDPSIYGNSGMNNPPFYGASKAAIIQLTKYLAAHITEKGIRTNAVSPGAFPPETIKIDMPEFHENLCSKNPMKRIGDPNEVAATVHFLLSEDSSYINGANIPVDGGWTAW